MNRWTMRTNEAGRKLIQEFEGCKLTTYLDPVGVPTIGFGHTGTGVKLGQTISQGEADKLFAEDLIEFEEYVQNLVFAALNSNQFSALVSFIYNVGNKNFVKSGMPKALNNGDFETAANIFPRYAAAGGKHMPGLYRRRLAEQALFRLPETV